MVSEANAERTPPAHMTSTWADLSGMRPSIEVSRLPLGRWTAPAMAPCSYSSGSRTSSRMEPGRASSASASSVVISRMLALAAASISLKVGTAVSLPDGSAGWWSGARRAGRTTGVGAIPAAALRRGKRYQDGQHSLRPRESGRVAPRGAPAGQLVVTIAGRGMVPGPSIRHPASADGSGGAASFGGVRNAGAACRSTLSRRSSAAASRWVRAGQVPLGLDQLEDRGVVVDHV